MSDYEPADSPARRRRVAIVRLRPVESSDPGVRLVVDPAGYVAEMNRSAIAAVDVTRTDEDPTDG